MKLEAVIVCKDYSDFLEHTLPENMQHFDHVVVVTHYSDKRTIGLCNKYSIDCVQTHAFFEEGAKFNKGRAINVGFAHLKGLGWILHIDADTLLPHRFRHMLDRARLNEANLYGADRVNVRGWERYQQLRNNGSLVPHYKHGYFVKPPENMPIGDRIVHMEHGYCPIGYFQLFHKSSFKKYPTNQGTAEHTDLLFAIQWAREQRVLLPEVLCYHLESDPNGSPMGMNWNGRMSSEFGPPKKGSRESKDSEGDTARKKR